MNRLTISSVFTELAAALFILLFLYVAIMKLRDPAFFAGSLSHSPLLRSSRYFLAGFIPAIELGAVMLLIIPFTRFVRLVYSTILMLLFTVYVAFILFGKDDLPCSCGGVLQRMNWQQHLWFNLGFLILGIMSLVTYKYTREYRRSRIPAI